MPRRAVHVSRTHGYSVAFLLMILIVTTGCAAKAPVLPPPGAHTAKTPSSPASEKAIRIVRTARTMLGAPYVWGGHSPDKGFDCSGLVWFSYRQNGVQLPRISWQLFAVGEAVEEDALRPADLVFYKVDKSGKTLHVGIVTDHGTFIHAPSSGSRVMESSIFNPYWRERYIGARRVI